MTNALYGDHEARSRNTRVRWTGLVVAAAAAILDQASKALAREHLAASSIDLGPILNLSLSFNRGVSFGLFAAEAELARWGLVLATAAIAVWVLACLWRETSRWRAPALGLIAGGAIGNILDRIRDGAVTDFIDMHLGDAHWPTFNLADTAIVTGVAIVVLTTLGRSASRRMAEDPPGREP